MTDANAPLVDRSCKKCGKAKRIEEFVIDRHTCRECKNLSRKAVRGTSEGSARERELRRVWYVEKGGKEVVRKNTRLFRRRTGYPGWSDAGAHHANMVAQSAIRSGKIVRAPCEICGEGKVHAHHDDYNFPLSVRWLYVRCHKDWHMHNEPIRARSNTP